MCYICGKEFRQLKVHIQRCHSDDKNEDVVCDKCGKSVKANCMSQHMSVAHNRNKICTLCDKMIIGGKRKLIDHLSKVHEIYCHEDDFYLCHICKMKNRSPKELQDHLNKEHQLPNDKKCTNCELEFPTKPLVALHLVDVHEVKAVTAAEVLQNPGAKVVQEVNTNAFPCQHCDKKFASYRSLFGHVRQVHDKANHMKCEHCDYTSYENYKMKQHILRVHTKAYKHPCDKCSFVTNLKSQLTKHIRFVHEKDYRHVCGVCQRKFPIPMKLQKHMLKEHDILYKF